jgi:hypothetical protein
VVSDSSTEIGTFDARKDPIEHDELGRIGLLKNAPRAIAIFNEGNVVHLTERALDEGAINGRVFGDEHAGTWRRLRIDREVRGRVHDGRKHPDTAIDRNRHSIRDA